MRILQVITLFDLGGELSVVVYLANSLVKEHELIVAAGAGDGKMWLSLHPSVICEHIPSLRRALSLLNEIKTIRAMRKLYKKYHPDIIHLQSSKAGLLGRIAFPSAKIVYTVHGFDSIRIAQRKYLFLEKMLQFRCRTIIGVSKYDEDNLCRVTKGAALALKSRVLLYAASDLWNNQVWTGGYAHPELVSLPYGDNPEVRKE